jgi:hypothetical protein
LVVRKKGRNSINQHSIKVSWNTTVLLTKEGVGLLPSSWLESRKKIRAAHLVAKSLSGNGIAYIFGTKDFDVKLDHRNGKHLPRTPLQKDRPIT